jgi:hypothetical protein
MRMCKFLNEIILPKNLGFFNLYVIISVEKKKKDLTVFI